MLYHFPLYRYSKHTHTHTHSGGGGSVVRRMNEVALRWARLVLGWVTVFGWVYHLGM